jgi:transcription elongation GreA/GreB family factor
MITPRAKKTPPLNVQLDADVTVRVRHSRQVRFADVDVYHVSFGDHSGLYEIACPISRTLIAAAKGDVATFILREIEKCMRTDTTVDDARWTAMSPLIEYALRLAWPSQHA